MRYPWHRGCSSVWSAQRLQDDPGRDFERSFLRKFDGLDEMMAVVRRGEIFGIHGRLEVGYYMRQNSGTAIYVAVDPDNRKSSDIRVAVRPEASNLGAGSISILPTMSAC